MGGGVKLIYMMYKGEEKAEKRGVIKKDTYAPLFSVQWKDIKSGEER